MRSFIVIVEKPDIKVLLELVEIGVDFLAEGHLVKFLKDGFVEPFADAVGLLRPGFSFGVVFGEIEQSDLVFYDSFVTM